MSLYNGPPRGGSRGGKDQFNWEEVKTDKFRENYLGASVKATVGRWQKNRDVFWYTREKSRDEGSLAEEVAAVKAKEEELMLEALGLKPKTRKPVGMNTKLDENEKKMLLRRGGPEDNEEGEDEPVAERDMLRGRCARCRPSRPPQSGWRGPWLLGQSPRRQAGSPGRAAARAPRTAEARRCRAEAAGRLKRNR
uniref:Multiple myeloma tumor-associated protein 2 n=1 Tax=Tetraselmis sp. GSL018 TaxID=582737 RepID=A0A061QLT8_9CHLO